MLQFSSDRTPELSTWFQTRECSKKKASNQIQDSAVSQRKGWMLWGLWGSNLAFGWSNFWFRSPLKKSPGLGQHFTVEVLPVTTHILGPLDPWTLGPCIPGTVGHGHRRHRAVAGHGHGTDGGSTRHHVWRRGVDHLGSTSDRKCCRFINRNAEKVNNRTVKLPQTSANENMGIKPVEGLW